MAGRGITIQIEKQSRIAQMIQNGVSDRKIGVTLGISHETARQYRKKLKYTDKQVKEVINDAEKMRKVEKGLEEGCTLRQICNEAHVSEECVLAADAEKMKAEDQNDEINIVACKTELEIWLEKHWRWENKYTRRRINPVTGMRIVYKGEKGHLITPYRPDRIFR